MTTSSLVQMTNIIPVKVSVQVCCSFYLFRKLYKSKICASVFENIASCVASIMKMGGDMRELVLFIILLNVVGLFPYVSSRLYIRGQPNAVHHLVQLPHWQGVIVHVRYIWWWLYIVNFMSNLLFESLNKTLHKIILSNHWGHECIWSFINW